MRIALLLSVLSCGVVLGGACDVASEDGEPALGSERLPVGSLAEVSSFGANPGQLRMFAYVPADMPSTPRPLVVALHGCQQNASQYTVAGWHELADLWKLYLIYPEQNRAVNNDMGCFNWGGSWDGAPNSFVFSAPLHLDDLQRDHAENASIKQMVDYMKDQYPVDDDRVYATGLSAGGGFTSVLLATWPDVFAGGIIVAGIPYGCTIKSNATTEDGKACVSAHPESHELNRTAQQWGDLVRAAYPGYGGPYPKVLIWHGAADYVVAPALVDEMVEQWTNVHGIDAQPDETTQVGPAEIHAYKNANGDTLVETFVIAGMGHGQPIDPAEPCGSFGAFFSDVGVCAASVSGQLFGLDGDGGGDPGDGDVDAGIWPPGLDAGPAGGGDDDDDDDVQGPGGLQCGCAVAPRSVPAVPLAFAFALALALIRSRPRTRRRRLRR